MVEVAVAVSVGAAIGVMVEVEVMAEAESKSVSQLQSQRAQDGRVVRAQLFAFVSTASIPSTKLLICARCMRLLLMLFMACSIKFRLVSHFISSVYGAGFKTLKVGNTYKLRSSLIKYSCCAS